MISWLELLAMIIVQLKMKKIFFKKEVNLLPTKWQEYLHHKSLNRFNILKDSSLMRYLNNNNFNLKDPVKESQKLWNNPFINNKTHNQLNNHLLNKQRMKD